ncbi:hypothetical protein KVM40_06920 [Helicobacter pylori]|nr:hypothetical protein KVM40_04675 [Helicobacter pylori]WQY53764.1 hypothetical protein KVM40_06920 [Helicobacter pylori]
MMRSLKIRGAFEKRFTPQQGGTSHAKKIKNIERVIIADFKTNFYQGVFYGFSK